MHYFRWIDKFGSLASELIGLSHLSLFMSVFFRLYSVPFLYVCPVITTIIWLPYLFSGTTNDSHLLRLTAVITIKHNCTIKFTIRLSTSSNSFSIRSLTIHPFTLCLFFFINTTRHTSPHLGTPRQQHSPWARATKSKQRWGRIRLLRARASTITITITSQVSRLLEVFH